MKRILLIEPVLAHYRKDLYECYLKEGSLEFMVLGGSNYKDIQGLQSESLHRLKHFSFLLFGHRFFIMKGLFAFIRKHKPDAVICSGVDFHHLDTLLLFVLRSVFRKRAFYWWSHANPGNQGRLGVFLRKWFYMRSTGILVYSENGRKFLLEQGIKPDRIVVINNAINYEDYGYLSHELNSVNSSIRDLQLLFCGRISEGKRLDLLIRAVHLVKYEYGISIKCWIIGGGDTDLLQHLAEELGVLDCIHFEGAKYGAHASRYFMHSDIFIYPKGIGLSLLHAFSYGIPVITTDSIMEHGPEIELLLPGQNGDLYEDGSAQDLVKKILNWRAILENNQSEISEICINRIIEKEYLPDRMASKAIEFFNKEIADGRI